MYRNQIKHRILSIFLVVTLVILTNVLVFSFSVSAEDEKWTCQDIEISLMQPYGCIVDPPMPLVDRLILDMPNRGLMCRFQVTLYKSPYEEIIDFNYVEPIGWMVGEHEGDYQYMVYDSKIEVSLDPPFTDIVGVGFSWFGSIPQPSIVIDQVELAYSLANQAPVALDDAYATDEDTTLNVAAPGVLGNDSDADGDPLTAVLVAPPSHGSLTLNSDGAFTYTPDADFSGSDTFSYKANDGMADSNMATVSITVNPINDPPVALDDAYATDEDTTLNVAAPGVLGNDSDPDGDPLTLVLVTVPAHGSGSIGSDGSLNYTPDADFSGSDTFSYKANDGMADSNMATVSITVNPINDPPVANITEIVDHMILLPVRIKVTPQTLNMERLGKWVKVHICDDSENTPQLMDIILDGSASYDIEGDPLTYDWTLTGPDGDIPVMDDVASQVVTLSAGSYTVTLVVNDGMVDSAQASEEFTLTNITISDLAAVDPHVFTLNGVPALDLKGDDDCIVLSFEDDAIAATVEVGLNVEMTLEGPVSGVDYIDVIQDKTGGNGKGKSEL